MKPSTLPLLFLFACLTLSCHKRNITYDVRSDALSNTNKLGKVHNWSGTYSLTGAQDTSYSLSFAMPIIVHDDTTIEFLYSALYQNNLLYVSSYNDTTKTIVYTAQYELPSSSQYAFDTIVYNYGSGSIKYSGYYANDGVIEHRNMQGQ
jgi:hypothetical protein